MEIIIALFNHNNVKKTLLLFLLLLMSNLFFCQEKRKDNAEAFSSKSGTLIKTENIEIGKTNKLKFQKIKYTDMISGASAVSLFIQQYSRNKLSLGYIVIIDKDELKSLTESLKIVDSKILDSSPEHSTTIV